MVFDVPQNEALVIVSFTFAFKYRKYSEGQVEGFIPKQSALTDVDLGPDYDEAKQQRFTLYEYSDIKNVKAKELKREIKAEDSES